MVRVGRSTAINGVVETRAVSTIAELMVFFSSSLLLIFCLATD